MKTAQNTAQEQTPLVTNRSVWTTVAVREITVKLRDKSFIFGIVFSLAIILISIGASVYFGNRTTDYTVGFSQPAAQQMIDTAADDFKADDADTQLTAQSYDSADAALKAVENDDVDAYLEQTDTGWKLTYAKSSKTALTNQLTQTISSTTTATNAAAQGIDLEQLAAGSEVSVATLKGEDNSFAAMMIGLGFAMIFYMATITFGVVIAQSVVEEKQNRIVEIIATAIPISQLLIGKIVGNILLATGQIALYAVVGLIGANLAGIMDEYGWVLASAGWFVAFYIVGFTALATIWAAVGAMASRSEDIGNISSPIMMISVVALFGGIYASGTVLQVLSYIPVASSIAMPMRLLTEDVAVWEPVVSLLICVLAAAALTRLGARIYQNNIMRSGSAVSWKQALKK